MYRHSSIRVSSPLFYPARHSAQPHSPPIATKAPAGTPSQPHTPNNSYPACPAPDGPAADPPAAAAYSTRPPSPPSPRAIPPRWRCSVPSWPGWGARAPRGWPWCSRWAALPWCPSGRSEGTVKGPGAGPAGRRGQIWGRFAPLLLGPGPAAAGSGASRGGASEGVGPCAGSVGGSAAGEGALVGARGVCGERG